MPHFCNMIVWAPTVFPTGLQGLLGRSHLWLCVDNTSVRSWAWQSSLKATVMQIEAIRWSVLPFIDSLVPQNGWENPLLQSQQSLPRLRSVTSEEVSFLQMSCTAQKQPGNNSQCFRTLLGLPGGPVLSRWVSANSLFPTDIYTHIHTQHFHQVLLNLDFSRDGNAGKIHQVFQCALWKMILLDLRHSSTDCPLQWTAVGLGTAAEARQPRG